MKMLRTLWLTLMLAVVAACGGTDKAAGPPDTLQRGISSDPETLDQHKSRSIQAADVIRDLGEGLVGYSATGELIPAAAQSWEISEDGLKYTFHLRDGLRWSNGEVLTASHFVAGMRRLVDPSTAAFYAEMLGDRRADSCAPTRATDTVPDQPDDPSEHVPDPPGLYR